LPKFTYAKLSQFYEEKSNIYNIKTEVRIFVLKIITQMEAGLNFPLAVHKYVRQFAIKIK
jgi:hypothetical protein